VTILALDPSANVGGAELSLLDVLEGLQARGHAVLLAAPEDGNLLEAASARRIRTAPWDFSRALRRVGRHAGPLTVLLAFPGLLRALWSLLCMIYRQRAELIYSNGVKCHLLSGMVRLFLWKPVVWHARDFIAQRGIARVLFPLARLARIPVIANSQAVAEEWQARGILAVLVHNGFNAKPLRKAEKNSSCLQLLSAGVLVRWKGFEVILRACSLLPDSLAWTLTICGGEIYETDGHAGERRRLEQLAGELAITDRVTFMGMVDDLSEYLQASDILLHGSVRPEPFGRVVAEAMLAETPVIASRGGGIPEIVRDGVDGLLYPMGDAYALRDAICRLAGDVDGRSAMGKSARARILRDFALEGKISQIEQVLRGSASAGDGWERTVTS
jgi:glycosyltransferase involved in cell wall biosynthesis